MNLLQRLLSFLAPAEPRSDADSDSLDSSLGIELTRLPPALDLSYHVMRQDGRRAGMLLVSESGRGFPFLGTWLEDAGGLWTPTAERERINATAPIPIPPTAVCGETKLEPRVTLVPLSSHETGYGMFVVRRLGLAAGELNKATFFLRNDWIQAVLVPSAPDERPNTLTAFIAVGANAETKVLILSSWWHETLAGELAESIPGGESISSWEEANRVWRIRCPDRLKQRVSSWNVHENSLPGESGGPEALAELGRFLEAGMARGAQFHQTKF